jgi:hypothetical protein
MLGIIYDTIISVKQFVRKLQLLKLNAHAILRPLRYGALISGLSVLALVVVWRLSG